MRCCIIRWCAPISFVGSTPVAKYIYKTAAAEGKRVQALGGAKNHLVVMPDADMPKTVEAIIGSAFGAAGERCLAGSVLVPVGDAADPLLELLVEKVNEMRVGDGSKRASAWGRWSPRIIADRVAGYIEKGVAEGAKPLLDGRTSKPKGNGFFLGPTIFDDVTPEMTIAKDEIFGPVLSVIRVTDARRSHRAGEPVAVWQRDFDLHRQRQSGARIFGARRSRHGGHQRRRGRAHGLLPVRGLEELVLRRSARARQRRRHVLHRAKSNHDPVVLETRRIANRFTLSTAAPSFSKPRLPRDWARSRSN